MNAADTALIIVATTLVLFMMLPGLALFCCCLARGKHTQLLHALLCHRLHHVQWHGSHSAL